MSRMFIHIASSFSARRTASTRLLRQRAVQRCTHRDTAVVGERNAQDDGSSRDRNQHSLDPQLFGAALRSKGRGDDATRQRRVRPYYRAASRTVRRLRHQASARPRRDDRPNIQASDVLHLDGIGTITHVNGIHLDDLRLDGWFEELNGRQAVLFAHLEAFNVFAESSMRLHPSLLDFMFDTMRAVANLVFSGQKQRFGGILIVSRHGGGMIPYLAHCFSLMEPIFGPGPARSALSAEEVLAGLASFSFDLAACVNPASPITLRELPPANPSTHGFRLSRIQGGGVVRDARPRIRPPMPSYGTRTISPAPWHGPRCEAASSIPHWSGAHRRQPNMQRS